MAVRSEREVGAVGGFKLGVLALACLSAASGRAEEPTAWLGEVTVRAKAPNTLGLQGDQVGADEIRQFDRQTVGTALNLEPGVNISKVGARNEQMIYVRGFDLRQVPVFLDGIPIYVPYDGYVDLGRFITSDLARIDVAKGFSSTIYGANTLGGAINLVTRRPRSAFEGDAGVGLTNQSGAVNSTYAFANVGGKRESWYAQMGVSYNNQPFYTLPSDFKPVATENGGRRENSYSQDYKVNVKLGLTPNARDEYALNVISQQGTKGTPPYAGTVPGVTARYWRWPYWNKDSIYFLSNTGIGAHNLKLRAYHDTFENSLYAYDNATYTTQARPSSFKSWYDDFTNGFSAEDDAPLSATNKIKVAYHWKADVHREHNAGEPVRHFRDLTQSLGLEDTQQVGTALSIVSGLSYALRSSKEAEDYNSTTKVVSDFKRGDTHGLDGQVGAFYDLGADSLVKATLARKSRFPTIKDRYSYRLGTALPNPDLKTERATHLELGYSTALGSGLHGEVNVFRSLITDLIQSVSIPASSCSSPPCTQMQNIGKATNTGAELGLNGQLGMVTFGGNFTYLVRENRSSTAKLTDTPRDKVFGFVTLQPWDAWAFTVSADAMSQRYSSSDGKQVAAGFGTVDLKASWKVLKGVTVEGGVRNAADKLYAYTEGYPEAGRTWFLQALAKF